MGRKQELCGWQTSQRQTRGSGVESEQRATLGAPVVPFTEDGARWLGRRYWLEVERATRRLVRARECERVLELRVLGTGPLLFSLHGPDVVATERLVRCVYAIHGGLLAQRPAGEISFEQSAGDELVLRSAIRGFVPRLAARDGEPHWTGALYNQVQSRIHVVISRRYFARLIGEAAR